MQDKITSFENVTKYLGTKIMYENCVLKESKREIGWKIVD
jgi:hypothetical protein